jgi:hypothetical protein
MELTSSSLQGERVFENDLLPGCRNKIIEYENKFKSLKMAFQDRAILHTGITVFRIFDNVEHLGECLAFASNN